MSRTEHGEVQIHNRAERIDRIKDEIQEVLDANKLVPAKAAALRGKLLFAQAQTFGRCGIASLRVLGSWATPGNGQRPSWRRVQKALRFWIAYFGTAAPRSITLDHEMPIVVYTDGACEGENHEIVTVGGILVVEGVLIEYFGFRVPEWLVSAWQQDGQRQVVGQAELLPVLVAKRLWGVSMKG